jgi:hydrogenase maturation protease
MVPAGTVNELNLLIEGGVQLALVIEDDPGHDLGMMRQPGDLFFYGLTKLSP